MSVERALEEMLHMAFTGRPVALHFGGLSGAASARIAAIRAIAADRSRSVADRVRAQAVLDGLAQAAAPRGATSP